MNLNYFERGICTVFTILGRQIARRPLLFILLSILIFVSLVIAIPYLKFNKNSYYMLSADKGRASISKKFIDKTFPTNSSISEIRFTKLPEALILCFTTKNGGNMLQKFILNEIQIIHRILKNTTIELDGIKYGYEYVCGKVYENCFENPLIKFITEFDEFMLKKTRLKYPVDVDPLTYSYINTNLNLGGVVTDDEGYIKSAKALRLMYFFDENNLNKSAVIQKWKIQAYKTINDHNFHFIVPLADPFLLFQTTCEESSDKIKPFIAVVIAVISLFSVITLMTKNLVRSKPWLGISSVVSAGMAVGEAFGFMSLCGIENTDWNVAIPILVLVTEIDDAYVIIACWRTTDPEKEVEKRMEETYSKAAVSTTITSLTNFFSYCIGITAPFPMLRSFACYSAACIFFAYFSQIIFFGACMALSGYRERKRIHPFSCHSNEYINPCSEDDDEIYWMKFFRNVVGETLSYPTAKVITILAYFIILSLGIWNFLYLEDGVNIKDLYPPESEMFRSFEVYDQNFRRYPYAIQVVVNQTLDYSDIKVQKSIEDLIGRFEDHPNIGDDKMTVSWFKYYKIFQNNPLAKYSLGGYDMSKKQDFIAGLEIFFNFKAAKQFANDVVFNQNRTEILCSRFFLIATNLTTVKMEENILNDLWDIAETAEFPVIIHHTLANYVEQGIIIRSVTYQLFWITGVLIIIIFVLFIPNLICAILIGISVVSTMIETVGFMYLWNVNLHMISVLNLILCFGFCVNYPIHISYAFQTIYNKNSNERMKNSLYHVGFPIIQGCLTTILGMLIILFIKETYVFTVYVKIVFLVTCLTTFHAMLFIPVVLSLLQNCYRK